MKIGIIIGSTRPGRLGPAVARWVHEVASRRDDAEFEVVDLADYDLDLLNDPTVPGAANRQYASEKTRRWSQRIDEFDGFVFVTPEYNHSVPAAMKNAVDVLYPEWNNKAVTFVGYGAAGAARAVEHWRGIVANLFLHATRGQVALSTFTDFDQERPALQDRHEQELAAVLDQLVPLAGAVATLRR